MTVRGHVTVQDFEKEALVTMRPEFRKMGTRSPKIAKEDAGGFEDGVDIDIRGVWLLKIIRRKKGKQWKQKPSVMKIAHVSY